MSNAKSTSPYTIADAIEFAEMAHEAATSGAKDIAFATSQAFYDLTRGYSDTRTVHKAFKSRIVELEAVNPVK